MLALFIWSLVIAVIWSIYDVFKSGAGLIVLLVAGSFVSLCLSYVACSSVLQTYLAFFAVSAASCVLFTAIQLVIRSRIPGTTAAERRFTISHAK
jgi:hypothetical protein